MPAGWIKAHRSMLEHPALQHDTAFRVWMILLLRAAHKPTKVNWKGQTVGLHSGQVAISVRKLARDYEIPYKSARGAIDRLAREECITLMQIKGAVRGAGEGAVGLLVSICNWERYQSEEESMGAVEGTDRAHQGRTEQEGEESKTEESKKERGPAPNGTAIDLDADLYKLGRQILGKDGGAMVTKVKRKLGLGGAVELFQTARTKDVPIEYIAAALRDRTKARADLCKA